MYKIKAFLVVLTLFVVSLMLSAGLTTKAQEGVPAWAPNTAYVVNQPVTYNGVLYKCLQAHTSQVGWEPPNVPALWQVQVGTPVPSNTATPTKVATNVPTSTLIPPTLIRTNTVAALTATNTTAAITNTPVPPTVTKTNTPVLPTVTKTNTVAPTTGGSCTVAPWNAASIYVGTNQASYNGHLWQAKWWTQGDLPGGPVGVWNDLGPCGTQPTASNTPIPTNTVAATIAPPTNTVTPGPSATIIPSPTLCTNCGGSLPEHVLTGYWQDFTGNGARALRLRDVPGSYGLIAVAFANATGTPGAVSFSVDPGLGSALGGYTDANFISDIQALHAQGRKVIVSVGGQNGAISVSDPTSATNFSNSVYAIMTQYGFDGVDIDLENGINATYMSSALKQLSARVGAGLIITLAPQTIDMQSTSSAYFQLALSIKNILTIVNMQYYNSGSMLGCDGNVYSMGSVDFLTALACIQLQGGLRPDQIGLGLPANSAGGNGAISPTIVNNALDCLETGSNCGTFHPATTYHGLRGAMDWDINWDANNSYLFASTITGHFSALP